MKVLRRMKPKSLRYKLFITFVLLILVPYALIQITYFHKTREVIEEQVSHLNRDQLINVKDDFNKVSIGALKNMIQLDQNSEMERFLENPEHHSKEEREIGIQNFVSQIKQQNMNSQFLNYILLDTSGNYYLSFPEPSHRLKLDEFRDIYMCEENSTLNWRLHEGGSLFSNASSSKRFYSLCDVKQNDEGEEYFLAISLDIEEWLKSEVKLAWTRSNYYIVNTEGELITGTNSNYRIPYEIRTQVVGEQGQSNGYLDEKNSILFNSTYLPSSGWYIVSRFPLDMFLGDIRSEEHRSLIMILSITILFIVLTYVLLSNLTQPLKQLSRKMSEMVRQNLRYRITEDKHEGEFLELAQSFNKMVDEIEMMIANLKQEEKQKQAIQYQMLISQMNPHFLLNTLNTMKWNARKHGDEGTVEISKSLGIILETSLDMEADLVHLRSELNIAKAYLYIQSFRYQHSFQTIVEIEEERLNFALVPKMMLQPLIENAIYHGLVHTKEGKGIITIRVYPRGDELFLEVEDNGVGLEYAKQHKDSTRRGGIGLNNLRERLRLLFGDQTGLNLMDLKEGTRVQIKIPFLLSVPYKSREGVPCGE
ncbi:histidine kinase [Paenibacillus sp. 2KB_20]|uniref:sensor histidine kinase n=1 Tax=Paenibacillus sp. 2KB_20 TaxID=3232977 RepID=UPI003F987900